MYDWFVLNTQLEGKIEEVLELEKQVLVLKTGMHDMAVRLSELEGTARRRDAWQRTAVMRDLSTRSL